MKCMYCMNESEEVFTYCPHCGAPAEGVKEEQPAPAKNEAAERILPAFKSGKFLAICVLVTLSFACTLFAGSFDLIQLLLMIFMWQVYAAARRNTVDVKMMRNVSGTVYANLIIGYIGAGACLLSGVAILGALSTIKEAGDALGIIGGMEALEATGPIATLILSLIATIPGYVFAIIFLAMGTLMLLFCLLGYSKFHALAKSAYQSVVAEDLSLIRHAKSAKSWLWVIGIFSAISALSGVDFFAAAAGGCSAAACIIAAVLIQKTFLKD